MNDSKVKYIVSLKLEGITLPPVQDILILGRDCPHGPEGIQRCFKLMAPDDFEIAKLDDERVQAVLISRRILVRMRMEDVIAVLRQRAFPLVAKDEVVKVDFRIVVAFDELEVPASIVSEPKP